MEAVRREVEFKLFPTLNLRSLDSFKLEALITWMKSQVVL